MSDRDAFLSELGNPRRVNDPLIGFRRKPLISWSQNHWQDQLPNSRNMRAAALILTSQSAASIPQEEARIERALQRARKEVETLAMQVEITVGTSVARIFRTHELVLEDATFVAVIRRHFTRVGARFRSVFTIRCQPLQTENHDILESRKRFRGSSSRTS